MFIQVNENCIVNINEIVWIDVNDGKMTIKLTDGSEHSVSSENIEQMKHYMKVINKGIEMMQYTK